ncbi:MAG: TonB-dependent receptor [Nitrospinae bacterium]|nr:TonB-dependent receptor [Nitrospinota bacterium]
MGVFRLLIAAMAAFVFCGHIAMAGENEPAAADSHADDEKLDLEPFTTLSLETVRVVAGEKRITQGGVMKVKGAEMSKVAGAHGDPVMAIQSLPGVTTANDSSGDPAVRGTGPRDNLYRLDFLEAGYLFHMGGRTSNINSDLIKDFTLYSAAFGPEYGDVIGAVVDIKLRDPRTDRLGAKVSMSIYEADFLVEGPVSDNQSFYFGARRSYIDMVLPKTGNLTDGMDYTQFPEFYDYQGKYVYRPNDTNTVRLQFTGSQDIMKLNIRDDSEYAAHDPVLAGDLAHDQQYHGQGIVWTSTLGSGTNTFGVGHLFTGMNDQLEQLGHAIVDMDLWQARDEFAFTPAEGHKALVGAAFGHMKVGLDLDIVSEFPSEFNPDTDYTSATRARNGDTLTSNFREGYIKDRWEIMKGFALTGGLRATAGDYLDTSTVEPRVGAEYAITEQTNLSAGWGKYSQVPPGQEIIDDFGNPYLSLIKADHYVAGIEHSFGEGVSAKFEGYYKDITGLTVPDEMLKYVNGASGKAYGAELLVKQAPGWGDLSGWISLAYAKSERKNEITGEAFSYSFDQPVIANFVVDYKFSERWSFGARLRYQSGAPFTPITGTYTADDGRLRPVYAAIGSERLPDYHRLDLRVDRRFDMDGWKMGMFFELINAYDQKNISGYLYNAGYTSRKPVYQMGLMPSFGIKAEF